MTPQASDERRRRWPGGDAEALIFLNDSGFRLQRDYTFQPPSADYMPTERELDAIAYLVEEWDYGGLRSGQAS